MSSLNDVLTHMERVKPMLGGYFSLEALTSLSKVFFQGDKRGPLPTQYLWADGSRFYAFDADLSMKIASATQETLEYATVPWSEDMPWKDKEVNRMDLAGMILELAALCKQVNAERGLYILFSSDI